MTTPSLVSGQWVEEHLGDPNVRIIEVSAQNDTSNYRHGHLPGAVWFNWKDLCWHPSDRELVTAEELAARLGAVGIGGETTLVLYGDPVQYGSYAFWALKMAGHQDLRLLDGTRTKWMAENRPLTMNIGRFAPVDYPVPQQNKTLRLGREAVRARLDDDDFLIIDARSPEEYRGERVSPTTSSFDHGAERKGRIPGAIHLFYKTLLNADDSFRSRDELAAIINAANIEPDKADEIACYCRLSHRATLVWFAFKYLLGRDNVRVYDGSWTEWGSIVGFPIER